MKNSKKGISLIVLIITIIVIVILATAILVSVISNNPISEANKARYESDRDNMQAVFTNTVGKIMAENQGVVNVTAGQINTETTGVNETTGEVAYTVDNAMVAANASGTIKFDKGTNDATTYYTGKKLPIYAAGETKWYVDSEGVLSLEVAGVKYGSGVVEGEDKVEISEPGIYDENNVMLASWDELVSKYSIDIEKCYNYYEGASTDTSSPYYIFTNNDELKKSSKLIIDDSVANIGQAAFYCCDMLTYVYIPSSIQSIDFLAFESCTNLKDVFIEDGLKTISPEAFSNSGLANIVIPDSVTNMGTHIFYGCNSLKSVILPNNITTIPQYTFMYCSSLTSVTLPDTITTIEYDAFCKCSSLASITITDSLTGISDYAFSDCTNLTSINYFGTQEQWDNINFVDYWNDDCPEITVHCTDGDIIIPANN